MTYLSRYVWADVTGDLMCPACFGYLGKSREVTAMRVHPDGNRAAPTHERAIVLHHSKCGNAIELLPGGVAVLARAA